MKYKLLYRFEDHRGIGPFQGNGCVVYDQTHRCRDRWHSSRDMPSPMCVDHFLDSELNPVQVNNHLSRWKFFFPSLKEIRLYFRSPKGRAAMANTGIGLFVYKFAEEDILHGEGQVVVRKTLVNISEPVAQLDLRTLKPVVF